MTNCMTGFHCPIADYIENVLTSIPDNLRWAGANEPPSYTKAEKIHLQKRRNTIRRRKA